MTFLAIRIGLLWLVIVVNILGGALWFKRFFPRESPWLGFVVPELVLIILLNFIEHIVALPNLLLLAMFGTLGSLWLMLSPRTKWRGLILPAAILFGAFTFVLGTRALLPDINVTRDGLSDVAIVSSFCLGDQLPPTDNWLPFFKDAYYYTFTHYSASIVIRALHIDIGTGFNFGVALLSAYTCFAGAAVAWRLSRGKVWVTVAMACLIESAASGSSALLWLTSHNLNAQGSTNPFSVLDDNDYLKEWLRPINYYAQPDLMVPGSWGWEGALHATAGGQFLTLLSVWCLVEILTRKRSNWPWALGAILPFMGIITSTWTVPLLAMMFAGAVGLGAYHRWRPQNFRKVILIAAAGLIGMLPMIACLLSTNFVPTMAPTAGDDHTQPALFLLQWWPVFLPWIMLCFIWRRLPPGVKIVHVLVPVMFLWVEYCNIGFRNDMTGKYWGDIYGIGLIAFFPMLASRKGIAFRAMTGVLLLSGLLSLGSWGQDTWHRMRNDDVLHMEGLGASRLDDKKFKIFQVMSHMEKQVMLMGRSNWALTECPLLGSLTKNLCYITWSSSCRAGDTMGEANRREKEVADFYDGKMADPLTFLRQHDIAAVVIWSGDHIDDAVLDRLKKQLAPVYEYMNYRVTDPPNVGIFVYHPGADPTRKGLFLHQVRE